MALLNGGTKTRTALQISDEQALLGAQIGAFSNLDLSIVRLSALKSKLDPSLELYADVILNPSFPEEDFKRQQRLQVAGIQREKTTPVQMGLRVFPALLYGEGHAYGNPMTGTGTTASVEKMTREDMVKFHDAWFKPNNATLVIAGRYHAGRNYSKTREAVCGLEAGADAAEKIHDRTVGSEVDGLSDRQAGRAAIHHYGGQYCAANRKSGRVSDSSHE